MLKLQLTHPNDEYSIIDFNNIIIDIINANERITLLNNHLRITSSIGRSTSSIDIRVLKNRAEITIIASQSQLVSDDNIYYKFFRYLKTLSTTDHKIVILKCSNVDLASFYS